MKKIVLFVVCGFLFANVASAQMKIGYINSADLLAVIPEVKKATTDLEAYQKTFVDQFQQLQKDFQDKYQAYTAGQKTMTDAVKEAREQELADLQKRIQSFEQSAEEKINKKRDELLNPQIERAKKAIMDVAKEKNYDYVFDKADGQSLLFAKDSYNILEDVKAKLGVK
jgi:outer membrane protein